MAFSGRAPTKAEREWLSAISAAGCVVCRLETGVYTPAMPHHIDGKKKPGAHMNTVPLCFAHHNAGNDCEEYTSRHPYKARFEARYGREEYLLEMTREMIRKTA